MSRSLNICQKRGRSLLLGLSRQRREEPSARLIESGYPIEGGRDIANQLLAIHAKAKLPIPLHVLREGLEVLVQQLVGARHSRLLPDFCSAAACAAASALSSLFDELPRGRTDFAKASSASSPSACSAVSRSRQVRPLSRSSQ